MSVVNVSDITQFLIGSELDKFDVAPLVGSVLNVLRYCSYKQANADYIILWWALSSTYLTLDTCAVDQLNMYDIILFFSFF